MQYFWPCLALYVLHRSEKLLEHAMNKVKVICTENWKSYGDGKSM